MKKLSSFALTLIGLVLTGLGVFLFVSGGDTLLGLMCIAFFGSGTLISLMDLVAKQRPVLDPQGQVLIYPSRLRALLFALGGGAFVFAGVAILLGVGDAPNWFVVAAAVAAIPFGLIASVFAGRQALVYGPLYTITTDMIEAHRGIKWRLNWQDVAGLSAQSLSGNAWIELDTFPYVADPPGWATSLNRRFGRPPYALVLGTSNMDFDAVCALVYEYWSKAQQRCSET